MFLSLSLSLSRAATGSKFTGYSATLNHVYEIFAPYNGKPVYFMPETPEPDVVRYAVYCRRHKPYAILLLNEPGTGKTSLANRFFPGEAVISGDALLCEILDNPRAFPALAPVLAGLCHWYDFANLHNRIFSGENWRFYADILLERANGCDFIFDGYAPTAYRDKFADYIEGKGWRTARLDTFPASMLSANAYSWHLADVHKFRAYTTFNRQRYEKMRAHGRLPPSVPAVICKNGDNSSV